MKAFRLIAFCVLGFLIQIGFLVFASVASAEQCPLAEPVLPLKIVKPVGSKEKSPVTVQFSLEGNLLKAKFEVRTKKIHAKRVLGPKEYPYHYDVVELFLAVDGAEGEHLPYYEFELSPYNQSFQVKVVNPKNKYINNFEMGLRHSVTIIPGGWIGEMEIPLNNLDWDGRPSQLIGNAFAIFGQSPNRTFWSLSLPQMKKANFHQPQYFKPLLNCSQK